MVLCDVEDCLFYKIGWCAECRECAYCGNYLYWTGDRSHIHFDHILPRSSGGRTVVPTCEDCNLSKHDKGLKEWLRWLVDNRPSKWKKIVEYNKWGRHKIAQAVRDVRDEYGY